MKGREHKERNERKVCYKRRKDRKENCRGK